MNVALVGYGKMGRTIEKVLIERGHSVVSVIDIENQDDFESEAFKNADVPSNLLHLRQLTTIT